MADTNAIQLSPDYPSSVKEHWIVWIHQEYGEVRPYDSPHNTNESYIVLLHTARLIGSKGLRGEQITILMLYIERVKYCNNHNAQVPNT